MKVNGIDIKAFGAMQQNVKPGLAAISNGSEWASGAASPLLLPSEAGMKKMEVSVIIKGISRQDIWGKASALVAAMMEPAEIELDGFGHSFFMALTNVSQAELSLQRFHKATLELMGYEHGAEKEEVISTASAAIRNEGNMESPAILMVTPMIGMAHVSVYGFTTDKMTGERHPIKISRLSAGRVIRIDGEKGLALENDGTGEWGNKFKEIEMWDFPRLQPGENYIQVGDRNLEVRVRYKPRYL